MFPRLPPWNEAPSRTPGVRAAWLRSWTTPSACGWWPQAGGEVLGYVGSQSVMGEADMMNLAVLPAARRQGIARALVTALIRELAGGGVHSLTLEVRASMGRPRRCMGAWALSGWAAAGVLPVAQGGREILRKEWDL